MDNLINNIKTCKKSFCAKINDNNKPYNNAANYGGKEGDIFVRTTDGEYTGFSIKLLENLKPLLTNRRMVKVIKKLVVGNLQDCIKILQLDVEVLQYNINIIYSVIKHWLETNDINVPVEISNNSTVKLSINLINWIKTTRSDPINCKIQIVDIGKSKKGNSVVPIDWFGKIFNNGVELHNEMNKLEWRQGKPPVNYCCIYSMTRKNINTWYSVVDVNSVVEYEPVYGINVGTGSEIIDFTLTDCKTWMEKLDGSNKILNCMDRNQQKYIVVCKLDDYFVGQNTYINCENVGLLVSRLQKCIRRGRTCAKLLYETVNKLGKAKSYNLPEQQFIRVSSNRQLCWRLFITIMEDVEPFLDNNIFPTLLDLVCFSIICHNDPDLQFNDTIINKFNHLALLVQHNDRSGSNWDWRKGKNNNVTVFDGNNDYIKLALKCMPMMNADNVLLHKSVNFIKTYPLKLLAKLDVNTLLKYSNNNDVFACKLAANDMHCNPNIILNLQSCLPFIPYLDEHNTHGLSSFIWEHSSKINIRNKIGNKIGNKNNTNILNTLNALYDIQNNDNSIIDKLIGNYYVELQNTINNPNNYQNIALTELESRTGFLLLFGQTIRIPSNGKLKSLDAIIGGSTTEPCIIKKNDVHLQGNDRFIGEIRCIEHINKNPIVIKLPVPPECCTWTLKTNKINITARLLESNKQTLKNTIKFYVNDLELKAFKADPILKKYGNIIGCPINGAIKDLIEIALYVKSDNTINGYALNELLRQLWKYRFENKLFCVFEWANINDSNKITSNIWKCVYTKIYNNIDDNVTIGPVDRSGNKLTDSINYLYEGTILRMFNLLSFLYPNVVIIKTGFKFKINKNVAEYSHFINSIKLLSFSMPTNNGNIITIPKIKTTLWNHQQKTVDYIFNNIATIGRTGFGDASNVGSGKTLSAISIMAKLIEHNNCGGIKTHHGFLILLPTTNLYDTWTNEINKHTSGFDIILQNSNGQINKPINNNSIVITTLGRMRDHPITNPWTLVVIDECLSVQNKEALQTEEAFRQILCAQYGVVMMSATFFRSRFDKLFYILKMLKSGLPEEKVYLDAILNECIVCNIGDTNKVWNYSTNKFTMDDTLRRRYNDILKLKLSSEQIYNKLSKLLYDNFNYIDTFNELIKKVNNMDGYRALIYAKSKAEADAITKCIGDVSRYPDKTKKHVVLSYNEGTYGLNDLIIYNVIITRPPNPDMLPQMKGKLDRFGQKNNKLSIEYMIIGDTIEEAELIRLEMCNNFYNNYILPLADFYDLAINKNHSLKQKYILTKYDHEMKVFREKCTRDAKVVADIGAMFCL